MRTCFWFDLARPSKVKLTIYDIRQRDSATHPAGRRRRRHVPDRRATVARTSTRRPGAATAGSRGTAATTVAGSFLRASTSPCSRPTARARRSRSCSRGHSMRFTTLGTGTISLAPARSCAGYLVETPDLRLLIDCGSGITRRLAERGIEWQTITHVALTHFHIDHHGDLPTLVFAWKYGFLPPRSAPVEIIGPPGHGGAARPSGRGVRRVAHRARLSARRYARSPPTARSICLAACGSRATRFHTRRRVWHIPLSAAGAASSTPGIRDRRESLATWASGCDVLVCECSLPTAMAIPAHLTPEQCGDARRGGSAEAPGADAFLSARRARGHSRASSAAQYAGPVTLARDGWYFEIEDE